jgi:hypothetical protein
VPTGVAEPVFGLCYRQAPASVQGICERGLLPSALLQGISELQIHTG